MNRSDQITFNEKTDHRKTEKTTLYLKDQEPLQKLKVYPAATMYGLTAGLLMGIYLLMLQMLGMEHAIALKFFKYVILAGMLGWGLRRYRRQNTGRTFFQNGIRMGALTTFVSAATLIVVNMLVGLVAPEWAFSKFNLAIDSPGAFLVTSGAIFFEVLVFGMVSTFIWLQYLKGRSEEKA